MTDIGRHINVYVVQISFQVESFNFQFENQNTGWDSVNTTALCVSKILQMLIYSLTGQSHTGRLPPLLNHVYL